MPHEVLDTKSLRRPWFRKDEQVFPKPAASAAKIVHAGGRVCIGGHGQIQGLQVMKNGELFEGDTLNQVWPRQKQLPELWWSKTKP